MTYTEKEAFEIKGKEYISTTIPAHTLDLHIADGWELVGTFTECGVGARCTVRRRILRAKTREIL